MEEATSFAKWNPATIIYHSPEYSVCTTEWSGYYDAETRALVEAADWRLL